MSLHQSNTDRHPVPTRRQSTVFRLKTLLLQSRRVVQGIFDSNLKRFPRSEQYSDLPVVADSRSKLWSENSAAERALVAGKIHNLRLAVRRLDGVEVGPNEVFSFWKHVGRASRFRGFVKGRELREGCIIPSIGGGLCQLSNALYDAALKSGFEIIERHPHTRVVDGSLAEVGRDATVFWNYVDLRFASPLPFRIEAKLDGENLRVRFRADKRDNGKLHSISKSDGRLETPHSCMTCGVDDCHRVVKPAPDVNFGKTAYLVDEFWPEFDEYIGDAKKPDDTLFIPIDGKRFNRANYAWSTGGFAKVEKSVYVVGSRSFSSRKLAGQGAARQLNLIKNYEKLALSYSRRLTFEDLHLVVQQELLPYLWREGVLGGRTFDVMMTALPMHSIQARLDFAFSLHPDSRTLADFRADRGLVQAEREALENARRIITSHSEIAALFEDRVTLVDWKIPERQKRPFAIGRKPLVVFPATTVARKGCYELRDALRGLDVRILTLGPKIEAEHFWRDFDIEENSNNWLEHADVVVLPAHVEHRPRRLLHATALGIPVIATRACGISGLAGVELVDAGDAAGLGAKIRNIFGG